MGNSASKSRLKSRHAEKNVGQIGPTSEGVEGSQEQFPSITGSIPRTIQIPQTPSLSKQERQWQGMVTQRRLKTCPEGVLESSPWQPEERLLLDNDQTLLTVHNVVIVNVSTSNIDFFGDIDPDWSIKNRPLG